jgi:hypothetical protein
MTKRSLFWGALALLAFLVFAGCSNPSSSDTTSGPVAGNPGVPRDAVLAGDFDQLVGLLNEITADTNKVANIAYNGDFDAELTIPSGKTVYWYGDSQSLSANLIVEEGARLVILGNSTLTTNGDDNQLLVKGKVDVYGGLTIGDTALDVADYYVTDKTIEARGTVIGTSRIAIGAGGILTLTDDDIANQTTPNRFTPTQAWAAAGQGDLTISGALSPVYSVTYMLEGIYPSAARIYTFETNGAEVPKLIPVGAHVTTNAAIADTTDPEHTLTVNGWLIAPNASLGAITNLTVSGALDTDNAVSRASSASPSMDSYWNEGYLAADSATLKSAVSINILDRGEFASESIYIELPEAGSKINLGRSAIFTAAGTTLNTFKNLTDLYIGPGADVTIDSTALTFGSLKTLTLQDGASLTATGGNVTFLEEATPANPPNKTQLTLGLNTFYNVRVATTAKVDVAITNNSKLIGASVLTINEGSTFTVAEGATLTVGPEAQIDFSKLFAQGTTVPANAEAAPVKINGAIELTGDGTNFAGLKGPELGAAPQPTATDAAKFVAFGDTGKIVFNYGTSLVMDEAPIVGDSNATYTWKDGTDDGAQIEITKTGITIRDTGGDAPDDAEVTIGSDQAVILKDQTLTLEKGVKLIAGTNGLSLTGGDANTGGAKLVGLGELVIDNTGAVATIIGGSNGWQAIGAELVTFSFATTAKIAANSAAATLKALGPGATIAVTAAGTLNIGADTTIELGGITTIAGGVINLPNTAILKFAAATSKILAGAGTGTTPLNGSTDYVKIGGITVTLLDMDEDNILTDANGFLNQIVGVTDKTITAGGAVVINSTVIAEGEDS